MTTTAPATLRRIAHVMGMPVSLAVRLGPSPDEVDATIEKAMSINDQLVVVDFRVHRDAMVWPMVAAGTSNDDIKYARDLAPQFDEDDI